MEEKRKTLSDFLKRNLPNKDENEFAIEIKNLSKNFGKKQAVSGLDMKVPKGAIYGFIGENGSGKSTTEKMICGLILPSGGEIKLFGKDYKDIEIRSKLGVLIETPGCFPNISVWENLMLQATNLQIRNKQQAVADVLKLVHMEGSASNKFKNCSLGMKQRIGIAMALFGNPELLVLDEPINGLDADGMRIMREVLVDLSKNHGVTILVSSHILGELEKIATHYGIIRHGEMIREMSAEELEADCPKYVALQTREFDKAEKVLSKRYSKVTKVDDALRIYDCKGTEEVAQFLYKNGILISEIEERKISLEEYYINLMAKEEK